MAEMTVLNPTGYPPQITAKPMAPRLDTLNGKIIYLVDCRFDDDHVIPRQLGRRLGAAVAQACAGLLAHRAHAAQARRDKAC